MTRYRKSWTQVLQEVREVTEVDEAVLVNRDYKYDGKKIHISKKNFKKVHKDYKNDTPGKERMITYDSKWGTVSVPVEFTEEVEATRMPMEAPFVLVDGVTGPTRMQIQKFFDKEKGLLRVRINNTEKAFKISNMKVDARGNVVSYGDESTRRQEIKSKIIDDSYHGTFAGNEVFIVDSDTFHTCRLGKQKYHRYEKYVGNGKIGQAIREFGLINPKKPIILQNGEDGPMLYLRYGGSQRYA